MVLNGKFFKKDIQTFFLFFIASLLFLSFCSYFSFLFPFCETVDPLCFRTVGKAILHGKVLYRDIYEHKGLYLYLIYAVGYLMNRTGFFGDFVIEILFSSFFMYFAYRTMRLFLGNDFFCKISVILSSVILFTSLNFQTGGYAEEYCLPIYAVILFLVLRYFKRQSEHKIKAGEVLLIGVLSAVMFWIKYTLLGITVGIVIYLMIFYISGRRVAELMRATGLFLVGFFLGSVPALLYFGLNHAFGDLWHVYFYNLLFQYGGQTADWVGLSNYWNYFGYGKLPFLLFTETFLIAVFVICICCRPFDLLGKNCTNALRAMFFGTIFSLGYGIIYYGCYQTIVVYLFQIFGCMFLYIFFESVLKEGLSSFCGRIADFMRNNGRVASIALGVLAAFLFALNALDNAYRMILILIYMMIFVRLGEWIKSKATHLTKLEKYFLRYLPHAVLYIILNYYETWLEIRQIYFTPDLWRCGIILSVIVLLIYDLEEDGNALIDRLKRIHLSRNIFLAVFLLVCTVYCYFYSGNAGFVFQPIESTVQYKLGEYIRSSGIEEPNIISNDIIDVGLYAYLDIDPQEKYFGHFMLDIDEIVDEKARYVNEGIVDYIVTVGYLTDDEVNHNYHFVTSAQLPVNTKNPVGYAILLYERNDIRSQ